jgi:ribosome biogenesis GTPase A
MRPRYSFSSRRTGHIENMRKQRKKFPDIAARIIEEADIILEVLDARFIKETTNPEIEKTILAKNKKIIPVINKADLVKFKTVEEHPNNSIFVSCTERKGIKELRSRIKILASQLKKEKVIVGVLGYPNTGKSTLINSLIGKHSTPTSSQAGYTRNMQKLKLSSGIVLLDSPGVIPKEEYSHTENWKVAQHAKVGARTYSKVKDPEQVIAELMKTESKALEKHYNIQAEGDAEKFIEELGRKKHLFKKGGIVDEDKVSRFILKEWQSGKIKLK